MAFQQAYLIQAGEGVEVPRVQGRRIRERNQRVGVARVANNLQSMAQCSW